jgi:hypothetical protein
LWQSNKYKVLGQDEEIEESQDLKNGIAQEEEVQPKTPQDLRGGG